MRLRGWYTIVAILAIGTLAAPFASAGPRLPGLTAGGVSASDACRPTTNGSLCQWFVNTSEAPTQQAWSFELPSFDRSLVSIMVSLDGIDQGWSYDIMAGSRTLSTGRHDPASSEAPGLQIARTSHYIESSTEVDQHLSFRSVSCTCTGAVNPAHPGQWSVASQGAFRIVYNATRLPDGAVPAHPAATRSDPQLLDQGDDAPRPEYDLLAAWFDEPRVGDGTFTVAAGVASLAHVEANVSNKPFSYHGYWYIDFSIGPDSYEIGWEAYVQGAQAPALDCYLAHLAGPHEDTLVHPSCDMNVTTSTLTARVPTGAVGSPGVGVPFDRMSATAGMSDGLAADFIQEDSVAGERYPFALGGPAVWDKLNPRLAIAPPEKDAWYTDPLAKDNIPNTMQVGGGFLATGSFLFGVVVLQRRRAQTRKLLDEIEAIERAHEADSGRALLELGRLESEFTRMLRSGKLNEAQYQTLSQRIASAATRFALRRELGLEEVRA